MRLNSLRCSWTPGTQVQLPIMDAPPHGIASERTDFQHQANGELGPRFGLKGGAGTAPLPAVEAAAVKYSSVRILAAVPTEGGRLSCMRRHRSGLPSAIEKHWATAAEDTTPFQQMPTPIAVSRSPLRPSSLPCDEPSYCGCGQAQTPAVRDVVSSNAASVHTTPTNIVASRSDSDMLGVHRQLRTSQSVFRRRAGTAARSTLRTVRNTTPQHTLRSNTSIGDRAVKTQSQAWSRLHPLDSHRPNTASERQQHVRRTTAPAFERFAPLEQQVHSYSLPCV
jgi:hypothetical protein